MEDATSTKEEKMPADTKTTNEDMQSVEAAAAEAGLTVVDPADGVATAAAAAAAGTIPPTDDAAAAAAAAAAATTTIGSEDSPYPYKINAGKDVISGKGGKVR
jgi:hypothetical protein